MDNPHVLITGGRRAGKSRYALELARAGMPRMLLATAHPGDDEMAERIRRHRAERGHAWHTIEEPLLLARHLRRITDPGAVVIVDCLTLWISNWMHAFDDPQAYGSWEPALWEELDRIAAALRSFPGRVIFVTNEVGLGIIPDNAISRRYADLLGSANQRVARMVGSVIMMVCGLPMPLRAHGFADESYADTREVNLGLMAAAPSAVSVDIVTAPSPADVVLRTFEPADIAEPRDGVH